MRLFTMIGLFFAITSTTVRADVESGPKAGEKTKPLKVLRLGDNDAYTEVECVAAREGNLTVYAFVCASEWSRPMARFLRAVDDEVADIHGAETIAVWLTDDQDKSKQYLPRGKNALKLRATSYAVWPGDALGPGDWSISPDAFLTVVVVHKDKVVESFAYVSVNETDAPKLIKTLKQAVKK